MRTLLIAVCLAQTMAPASVVTIDATVLDRNGRPATGLTAADFHIELDGQARRILSVTYLPSGPPMAGAIGPVFDSVTSAGPVYRLLVEPPDGTSAGREFSVTVAVSRQGAKVQAAPRAAAAAPAASPGRASNPPAGSMSTADRLRSAIATGRAERGLPIAIGRVLRRAADPAQISVDVAIDIGGSPKPPVTALFGLVDAQGAVKTTNRTIDAAADGVYGADFTLPLVPGAYKLRLAAADASGAIGSVESTLDAKLTRMGPLLASDLLRWVPDRRLLILDHAPPGTSEIGAMLELYPEAGAPPPADLVVKIALMAADAATGIERIVTPEPRDGILVAEAEFPFEGVALGRYVLRATVMSGNAILGTVAAAVIKR